MHRVKNWAIGLIAILMAVFVLSGCVSSKKDSTKSEQKIQKDSYNAQVATQPARKMEYSPTRDTINFWIKTWGKKNTLSYVYLMNNNGDLTGYYVMKGLPVSYCAALTPTYKVLHHKDGNVVVPAPGVDGVYYSGGQCNTYFGADATTGAYLEYTVGNGQNVLLYNKPLLNHPNVQPLGDTKITK